MKYSIPSHISGKLIFAALFCALVVASGPNALADKQLECKAVQTVAKLGATDWDTVSVSGDKKHDVCRFSVNGVAAGSPPQEEVFAGYQSIVGSRPNRPGSIFIGDPRKIDVGALAALMLAAGPDTDTGELSAILNAQRDMLSRCMASFQGGQPFLEQKRNSDSANAELTCQSYLPSGNDGALGYGPISVRFDTGSAFAPGRGGSRPHLILVVQRGDIWIVTLVPKRY